MHLPSADTAGRWTAVVMLALGLVFLSGSPASALNINEIRIDNPGGDTDEYFELAGTPGQNLTGYTYLVIGDGAAGSGVIENVADLTGLSIQADGYLSVHKAGTVGTCGAYDAELTLNFENSDNVTHLLVQGFSGANGDDLDTNDDGVLDVTPWTSIVDCVAFVNPTATPPQDFVYCDTQVGPDTTFWPGHIRFCGTQGWLIGAFGTCTDDTPGAENSCVSAPSVDDVYQRPLVVEPGASATVYATVTDQDGTLASVNLIYRLNGGSDIAVAMSNTAGNEYMGTIPAQVLGTLVEYAVEATDDDGLVGRNPASAGTYYSYAVQNEVILPIADVHADVNSATPTLLGTVITVQGQVYCPGDYRADGGVSAYIQDASGRGINIFGDVRSTGMELLNDTGNVVKISGTLQLFFTTVEILNYEVTLVSSGNPPLSPAVKSTGSAALYSNEGTFIESTGVIHTIEDDIVGGGAWNFTINDGSGDVVVRVDNDLRPDLGTGFGIGDEITARGAGSTFSGQGQILVCSGEDIVNNGFVGDILPPNLVTASLTGPSTVLLQFDEAIDATTGGTVGNYSVFQAANPANTVAVSSAAVQLDPTQVVLSLGSSISGVQHRVRVNNVEDLAGNPIAPNTEALILDPSIVETIQITEIMQNPSVLLDTVGEWFEIQNYGAQAVDINGWTIQDAGTNVHVIDNGGPLLVQPGTYAVLARDAATLSGEGVSVLYQYGNFALGNDADEIILLNSATQEVDRVEYDGGAIWPDPNGYSMQWNMTGDNNDGTNWSSFGSPVFGSGDRGTPGSANDFVTPAPPQPLITELQPNRPNPFNPSTSISFSLERSGHVTLSIYNLRGQRVRVLVDEPVEAGLRHQVVWNGTDARGHRVMSGTYFYRLETEWGEVLSRKMSLIK